MKTLRTLGAVAVTGTVLALLPAGSALAAGSGDTTATFVLAAGTLDITVDPNEALPGAASGATSVSGNLGLVGVSDTRGNTAGWVVSAESTPFTRSGGGANSTSTAVAYSSGTVTVNSGTVTVDSEGLVADITDEPAPVVDGTAVSGNNTASFNPNLNVALDARALAGTYTGTVTTSVA